MYSRKRVKQEHVITYANELDMKTWLMMDGIVHTCYFLLFESKEHQEVQNFKQCSSYPSSFKSNAPNQKLFSTLEQDDDGVFIVAR